jgi:hypothetical protein
MTEDVTEPPETLVTFVTHARDHLWTARVPKSRYWGHCVK